MIEKEDSKNLELSCQGAEDQRSLLQAYKLYIYVYILRGFW